jgi:hypothetical protein
VQHGVASGGGIALNRAIGIGDGAPTSDFLRMNINPAPATVAKG